MYTNFHFEGAVYSNELPNPMTLKEAKKWIKNWLGVSKIPKNTEIY